MARKATYRVKFRRRREGKTNYAKRLKLLKSRKPRFVVRTTNRYVIVQVIETQNGKDRTISHANSKELWKIGFPGKRNTPSAYLTALKCAKEAIEKGVKEAILDIGLATPVHKGVVFAALKGALDAGLDIPFSEEAIPTEDRISGKHIEDYANSLTDEKFEKIFSEYIKKGINPRELTKLFTVAKKKILAGTRGEKDEEKGGKEASS